MSKATRRAGAALAVAAVTAAIGVGGASSASALNVEPSACATYNVTSSDVEFARTDGASTWSIDAAGLHMTGDGVDGNKSRVMLPFGGTVADIAGAYIEYVNNGTEANNSAPNVVYANLATGTTGSLAQANQAVAGDGQLYAEGYWDNGVADDPANNDPGAGAAGTLVKSGEVTNVSAWPGYSDADYNFASFGPSTFGVPSGSVQTLAQDKPVGYVGLLIDSRTADFTVKSLHVGCSTYLFGELTATSVKPVVGGVGSAIAHTNSITVTGGTAPYSFAEASGSTLPTGLTVNGSTGAIEGTPTVGGAGDVTIVITDAVGLTTTVDVTYSVLGTVPSAAAVSGTVGKALATPVTFATVGGTSPYVYSVAGSLPAGLTMAADGTISGTPTADGSFTVRVLVTDAGNPALTTSATLTFAIAKAAVGATTPAAGTTATSATASESATTATATASSSALPVTGSSGTPIIAGISAGIIVLGAAAAFVAYRRRASLTH